MSNKIKYCVYLRPEFITLANELKQLIKNENCIICTEITPLSHCLELKVPYFDPTLKEEKSLEIQIPHSYILYILTLPDQDLNKVLGFCLKAE